MSKLLPKKSVVDIIIEQLLSKIMNGEYYPGTKLPSEYELMENMQVGRNSLREAMKILSTMGIVEIRQGDGTYVCSQIHPSIFDSVVYSIVSEESSEAELIELRLALDESIMRMAMDKMTDEDLWKLEENINKMQEALLNGKTELAQQLDFQFHMGLIESCKNILFIRIAKGIYTIFERSIHRNIRMEKMDSKAPQYHQKILACIRSKDRSQIPEIVRESLLTWKTQL